MFLKPGELVTRMHLTHAIAQLLAGTLSKEQATWSVGVLLAIFFGLRLGVVVFGALQNKQADDLWLDTVSTFRQRVFDNMTQKSIDYFEKTRVGEIMDRFSTITSITIQPICRLPTKGKGTSGKRAWRGKRGMAANPPEPSRQGPSRRKVIR